MGERWRIVEGDCVEAMRAMPEASVDAVVCDPPYGLEFMGKQWDSFRVDDPGTQRHRGERAGSHGELISQERAADNHPARNGAGVAYGGGKRPTTNRCVGCGKRDQFRNVHEPCGAGEWRAELIDPHAAPPTMLAFQEWCRLWALEAKRVLKPGGHLLAFGGTRTYHRLACAIEDAGFEIRDCLAFMYGSGFPKSLNLDRMRGDVVCGCEPESSSEHDVSSVRRGDVSASESDTSGAGSVLLAGMQEPSAPAHGQEGDEPANGRPDESGVEGWRHLQADARESQGSAVRAVPGVGAADGADGRVCDGAPPDRGAHGGSATDADGGGASSRPRSAEQRAGEPRTLADESHAQAGGAWPICGGCGKPRIPRGLGTALKPAHEPIVLARKPLSGTVASTVLAHGTGALNVDGCRIGTGDDKTPAPTRRGESQPWFTTADKQDLGGNDAVGRWPANVCLDPEAAAMLDEQTGEQKSGRAIRSNGIEPSSFSSGGVLPDLGYGDSGGASRFLYVAKASSAERNAGLDGFEEQDARTMDGGHYVSEGRTAPKVGGPRRNVHPTVKPIELMRWLVRLVTPPNGIVLDPFAGSGTTGAACALERMRFVGIEREAEYAAIARARIAWWSEHPDGMKLVERLEAEREHAAKREAGQIGLF